MKTVDQLLAETGGGPVFTKTVYWTVFGRGKMSAKGHPFTDIDEARANAFELARKLGWTPPRLWQWWRWLDERESSR